MGGDQRRTMDAASSSLPRLAAGPVGKKIGNIYRDRLKQFTSKGQYESQNLIGKLYEGRASGDDSVKLSVYGPPNLERPTFKDATSHEFRPARKGDIYGPSWATFWFKIQLTVPANLREKEHLEFHWDANNEGLIWTEHGDPVHGLTGGGERTEWILPDSFRDGTEHLFYIEMACNGMFGNGGGDSIQPPNPEKYFQLNTADIVAVNLDARALYVDFWIIGDAAREFPGDSWESHRASEVCNEIMDTFIAGGGSKESIKACREVAQKYIGINVDSEKVYETDQEALITAVGHCHIDTCWLWPWAETKRKVARSWSNQCDLMDRYPELRFCCSQAQQYQWLEKYYPSLWDRVKAKVKEGKFQPIGGSWVEHDTNLPSGESLVRQFLYGQRFFESRFGQRSTTFWLPDTFGYSSQLPQLCRLAGMSRFFTQKLSWNNINNFPHTTFNWVALDGSQVLCHMTPAETYTAEAHFGDVKRSVTQHKSMDQDATSLLIFGKGDGGGGPTFEHIEKLRRCRGISDTVGLLPRVKLGDSVDDFFAKLEKKAENGTKYVTWYGELYFELHRGTYTTQANNKKNNRQAEVLLRDIEYFATLASIKDLVKNTTRSGYRYPKKDLDRMWESVLLCQFHDCLPGSSIEMCYDDSDKLYAKVFKTGQRLLAEALSELEFTSEKQPGSKLVYLNTLPWERTEIVKSPSRDQWREPVSAVDSEYHLAEPFESATDCYLTAPTNPLGHQSYHRPTIAQCADGSYLLANHRFEVKVTDGVIVSLYDKYAEREVIPPGQKANQLVLFDDKPLYWQAWDVEVYHLDSRTELKPTTSYISESDPHRVSLVVETKISDSSWVKTTISLNSVTGHGMDLVEMESEVKWYEDKKFLKVEFPVDVLNTEASYETQFGIARRPTHYNTTWDMAKFEVCCHRWADLSEAGYGVSILNDSKYGFATVGNVMRLSLLRAPKAPDANADMGHHRIRYAIMPHAGPLSHHTVRAGYAFNNPLQPTYHSSPSSIASLLSSFRITGSPNLFIDTIKRGEDDADVSRGELPTRHGRNVIVRVYDALGGRARGWLRLGAVPVGRAWKTNLLEDEGEEVEVEEGRVRVELRAFEVATYRLLLEGE
ncbi:putative alpha-mannosidase I [Eremomyces bilateralis CBS 781.70]|uniref:Alpha-mannosidase n=1 Tax=Eremomyces bilateralis CBS 781.70 TaxID=1392243 RepID=A0A6G1G760_9PEZI|nr:putative alpha-mannosidase I [Eremomyces bilateralis CBS 781.70]KAF1813669.1 putative alpha-mannosidase I [Eremomyces bilateralis CBS 781.70]